MLIQKAKPKHHRQQHYHGHTIIELRNARTGIRDRVEHDNDFTLGIDQYLTDGGFFNNSPFANETWRTQAIYRNLIGGIFLFDSAINEVDDELPTIMPAGTKMVANGSFGVTNNASPTELGSYNSNESSFTSSGLTFVYDWTTSQGNGTIECVSLTSDTGGYIGYGNSVSQVAHSTNKTIYEKQNSLELYVDGIISYAHSVKGNYRYDVTSNVGTTTATTFTYVKKSLFIDKVTLFPYSQSFTVEIPSNVTMGIFGYISAGYNGKIALFPAGITANTQYTMGIYDCDAGTWEYVTFTSPVTWSNAWGDYLHLTDDFLYVRNLGNTASNEGLVVWFDGTVEQKSYGFSVCEISENLYLGVNNSGKITVVDTENNTNYLTNGYVSATRLQATSNNQLFRYYSPSSQNTVLSRYRNPLYLATVNNLDNAVVKTTSDTMKVIYTVTPI